MSIMFHDGNRQLQDRFDSRRISDRLEEKLTRTTFTEDDKTFIENAAYFFLATADAQGQPDCSFKGGLPGFVRITGASELAFPDYDGNGMFKSLGNVVVNENVGLLFIAMHGKPKRLRINGTARVSDTDPLLGETVGAQLIVRVQARAIFPNCPRYIPDMQLVGASIYTPQPNTNSPEPAWKGFDSFKDAVHPRQANIQRLMMVTAADALTHDFLGWVAESPRSYADAEAWRRSCPHLSIWEDALSGGLVRYEAGASMREARLVLTAQGRARLAGHQNPPGFS